jgi:hypothetical protein
VIPIDPMIEDLELVVYAKDQPEYLPLPCRRGVEGTVVTCWKLSLGERLRIFLRGTVYITLLTFNRPLQPILCSLDKPETLRPDAPPAGKETK